MAGRILSNCLKNPNEIIKISSFLPSVSSCKQASTHKQPFDPVDEVTHTGQTFDEEDYKLARFIDKKKHVNKQFAAKLIDEAAPAPRKERVVWCDGGGGPTGHPKVYINLDKPGNHACGYCGLRFFKEPHHH